MDELSSFGNSTCNVDPTDNIMKSERLESMTIDSKLQRLSASPAQPRIQYRQTSTQKVPITP